MGLLKIDVLAIGMLTAIRGCFDLLPQHHPALRIEDIPQDDGPTYAMLPALRIRTRE